MEENPHARMDSGVYPLYSLFGVFGVCTQVQKEVSHAVLYLVK